MASISWYQSVKLLSKSYVCGHCGSSVASEIGYYGTQGQHRVAYIYICHQCDKPTYFISNSQVPGPHFGQPVKHIPDVNVEKLYDEAMACFTINAFTSCVMCSRKLLMNLAVSEGAVEGNSF